MGDRGRGRPAMSLEDRLREWLKSEAVSVDDIAGRYALSDCDAIELINRLASKHAIESNLIGGAFRYSITTRINGES